mgnify:CR=1 FL=1
MFQSSWWKYAAYVLPEDDNGHFLILDVRSVSTNGWAMLFFPVATLLCAMFIHIDYEFTLVDGSIISETSSYCHKCCLSVIQNLAS